MKTNRRAFLGTAAAGTLAISSGVHGAETPQKLRLGVVGVGWYGMVDAKAALKAGGVCIAAVCDIDSEHLAKSADELEKLQGTRPKTFKLYDDMLAEPLDAVIIGSPPHWHALHLLAALDRGLDVYCEKPLSYDVREGRAMVDAVKRSRQIVQIGFQRRQSQAFAEIKEFIASGGIGKLVQVDAQIHYRAGTKDPTPQDPPASLDWDLWCGPGPKIPYSPQVGHHNWRLEKTSGHGHLVDWGIHWIDSIRMVLGLGSPNRCTAAGGIYHYQGRITTPDTLTVHFEFDKLPVVWRHRLWGSTEYAPETNNGIFFYGDAGTVFASDRRWVFLPPGKKAQREEHEAAADMGTLHMDNFLECMRSRKQPACTVEDAYRTTSSVQLAMIAQETNTVVAWDAAAEQIPDNPAAAALLKRDYRAPWKHPYSG